VSAIESYSPPKRLVARVRRATRPSSASNSAANTITSAARSMSPLNESVIE
jgi:hypothetical protein